MPPTGSVNVSRQGVVARVEWERPPVNVLDSATLEQLARALRSREVTSAHVVVLRGRGKAWSAGLSVEEHLKQSVGPMLKQFRGVLEALWDVPVPTLAQVHGACLGGGLEMLAMCDVAVASATATLGQPEVRLGVFAPLGAAFFPRVLGDKRAAELLYLGESMTAEAARSVGLVNRVVPDAELEKTVEAMAASLAGTRRASLVCMKQAIRASAASPWAALDVAERIYLDTLMAGPGAEEGLRAFLEKRKPEWKEE
ncbi:MAG: enoyl-CoA hydratase/isomerase family protein [Candidatus Thermoplasmatota archaeon]